MKSREKYNLPACRPSRPFPAGFTLVEVVIVTLILGIVAMLGLPTLISGLEDSRLSGAASDVVTALEFSQLKALNSGCQTRVTVDVAADTILVEQFTPSVSLLGSESELNESAVESGAFSPVAHPLERGVDYNIHLMDQALFGGVDVTAVDFGGADFVTYGALGAPSSGGTVTLAYGNRQVVVSVDPLTGKVTVNE